MTRVFAILALAWTIGPGVASVAAQDPHTAQVYNSIRDRLTLMKPVAVWKTARELPIEDLEREKVVVQSSMRNAEAVRIDGASAKAFFEAQIAAAKDIQSCWVDRWSQGTAKRPEAARDLVTDIRPRLIDLGADILRNVAVVFEESEGRPFDPAKETEFVSAIDVECLSDDAKREIYRALVDVKPLEQ